MSSDYSWLNLDTLLSKYKDQLDKVQSYMKSIGGGSINPSQFLQIQYMMGQTTAVGESLSNIISQITSILLNMVRNQKTQ